MHTVILVVGDVESEMEPFNEQIEVAPWLNEPLHEKTMEEFTNWAMKQDPTILTKTFEEIYKEYGTDYLGGDEWRNNNGTWEVWSTYNPKGRWDWYSEGGRWTNNITNKSGGKCDKIDKKEYKNHEYCGGILYKGEWHETDDFPTKEKFNAFIDKIIKGLDDDEWISTVDYHC